MHLFAYCIGATLFDSTFNNDISIFQCVAVAPTSLYFTKKPIIDLAQSGSREVHFGESEQWDFCSYTNKTVFYLGVNIRG